MAFLTFSDKDILNSELHPSFPDASYRIKTHSGLFGRRTTALTPLSHGSPYRGIAGEIDWKAKKFQIGGVKRKWKSLKRGGGVFSSGKEWHWSGRSYVVRYHDKEWTATRHSWGNSAGAVFRLRRTHLFRSNEPASISFSQDIPPEDMVFLILVFLYSETKRRAKGYAEASNPAHSNHAYSNQASTMTVLAAGAS
ncbi:hypothetical protein DXG03_002924 [Asterophora parasitica]|uniref:DUF6593 domain-containing protein n=1 Tax=Asterophora parasitica TaxID=117018 RepID=A0A9P7KF93_9AGAR|nr:hypothetical protein DXG03_002924 [Asterophora parasitica]